VASSAGPVRSGPIGSGGARVTADPARRTARPSGSGTGRDGAGRDMGPRLDRRRRTGDLPTIRVSRSELASFLSGGRGRLRDWPAGRCGRDRRQGIRPDRRRRSRRCREAREKPPSPNADIHTISSRKLPFVDLGKPTMVVGGVSRDSRRRTGRRKPHQRRKSAAGAVFAFCHSGPTRCTGGTELAESP
jgi:hypothetical protein